MSKRLGFLLAALVIGLAGAAWWVQRGGHGSMPALAERPVGGDFTLQTANGPISLRDLRGKVVLLYFGYTHCPDVCPASMAAGSQALTRLSPEERGKTRLLYVSVDPARDTPARLKEYTAYFHPDMIGATGTPEQIAAVTRAYGASYARQAARPDGGYAVDHSAQTYVIGPDGRLAGEIEYGANAAKVVDTVRKFLP
ncbi:MAG: SCO family protein [Sulfuricella sp.]|nr:SCO family protein [Sulfuricella sp.]